MPLLELYIGNPSKIKQLHVFKSGHYEKVWERVLAPIPSA